MEEDERAGFDATGLIRAAADAFNAEDYDRAETLCRGILAKDPAHGNAMRVLALIDRERGKYRQAVERMDIAIGYLPGNAEAQADLGKVYEAAGDYFRAAEAFRKAAEMAPTRTDYHTRYVEALLDESHVSQGLPIVGRGSMKSYTHKVQSGFFRKYLSGPNVLDIGFRGDLPAAQPIVPAAIGIDVGYPGYDGLHLPFPDLSQDAVHSSHCLEHVDDPAVAIREWHRVLKIGGFLVVAVPHQFLYERKKVPPSLWNLDHKHFFTPGTLLALVERALAPNSYRVRHLADNDFMFDYAAPVLHSPSWGYEIEMVLERIEGPSWTLL